MTERALTIPPAVDASIRRHGQETYPHECCGALVGRDDHVADVMPLPNTTEEGPRRRFPDHPARPSQYDLDHAWPNFAYIIVAVAQGAAADMTVWFLKEDRSSFDEGRLNHAENTHSHTAQALHR